MSLCSWGRHYLCLPKLFALQTYMNKLFIINVVSASGYKVIQKGERQMEHCHPLLIPPWLFFLGLMEFLPMHPRLVFSKRLRDPMQISIGFFCIAPFSLILSSVDSSHVCFPEFLSLFSPFNMTLCFAGDRPPCTSIQKVLPGRKLGWL